MTVWRYEAVSLDRTSRARVTGVLPAVARADARTALRRIGLQALVIEPLAGQTSAYSRLALSHERLARVMRARRMAIRSELADSIATMLDTGMTLSEALRTAGTVTRDRSMRAMLVGLEHDTTAGTHLGEGMRRYPQWFDSAECALIDAGHQSGELARAWRTVGARLERRTQATERLIGVAAYPALVASISLVAIGYLGTTTLPELVRILDDASVATPRLTTWVMGIGGWIVRWGWISGACALVLGTWIARTVASRWPGVSAMLRPRVVAAMSLARSSRTISDLLSSGVPLVDALRIAAPASGRSLRSALDSAASAIQRGEGLEGAFADTRWFDAETRRVLALAQATGDLAPALGRLADRLERKATRTLDALSRAAEPVLILLLAVIVGTIVMAAVLPLIRLQEVL